MKQTMKVPKAQLLPSGNYFIRLRLGGQSIPITAATETECMNRALLIKAEYRNGKRVATKAPKDLTLREAITQHIENGAKPFNDPTKKPVRGKKKVLSPSTIRGYEMYKKERFAMYMDKKLSSFKVSKEYSDWQNMIDAESVLVNPKTLYNAWGLVHSALAFVDYPIPNVCLPEVETNEIAYLQPEEIAPLLKEIKGKPYEIPLLLELHGLRLSEAQGLSWENIDTKKGTIKVKGAKVRSLDGYQHKDTNKTKESSRTVPIMIEQLTEALDAVKDKSGPVVTASPPALLADIKRACRKAGVTEVTNHGLRHSFASLCYYLGISERQTMAWGGWSDYQTMHKIYIRLAKSAETEDLRTMRNFFEKVNENVNDLSKE